MRARLLPNGRHNRPNCLILGRFAEMQGANRFGRLILANRKYPASTAGLVLGSRRGRTYFVERIRAYFQAADDLPKGSVAKDSGIPARPAAY
jgi:hypothetical protein